MLYQSRCLNVSRLEKLSSLPNVVIETHARLPVAPAPSRGHGWKFQVRIFRKTRHSNPILNEPVAARQATLRSLDYIQPSYRDFARHPFPASNFRYSKLSFITFPNRLKREEGRNIDSIRRWRSGVLIL